MINRNDDELNMILDLISKHIDVSNSMLSQDYPYIIKYIINEGYPHLIKKYAKRIKQPVLSIYRGARRIKKVLKYDDVIKTIINNIASCLKNNSLFTHNNQADVSHSAYTKVLFGFDYTIEDLRQRKIAIRTASSWFEKKYSNI